MHTQKKVSAEISTKNFQSIRSWCVCVSAKTLSEFVQVQTTYDGENMFIFVGLIIEM